MGCSEMAEGHLVEWARLPGPAKVLSAARRRLESGHRLSGSPLRVPLSAEERNEVGRLLGVRWVLSARAVSLNALDEAVSSLGSDLISLLAELGGPLRDRPAERAMAAARSDDERRQAINALFAVGVPEAAAASWVDGRSSPSRGSGGGLAEVASRCAAVWRGLPTDGSTVLLTVLAANALRDPHALDRGSPVAAGVLRLAYGEVPTTAEAWRRAWEELGVVVDPVSSRVLVLNLPLDGDAAACALSSAARAEPLWLTWRSLDGDFSCTARDVFVCENPSVVTAAADRLGPASHPLVCTNGRPSAATRRLLLGVAAGGAALHVHADDDPAGQDIVKGLLDLTPAAQPWRYLCRTPRDARYEEQDIAELIDDLRAVPASGGN